MELTGPAVAAWVGAFWWPFIRVGAMVGAAPLLGARMLPVRVRLTVALVLTWALLPFVPPAPAVEPISPTGLAIAAQQLLIGLTMGFMLKLVFAALEIGGNVVAMQMGLGFANLVDPQNGGQMPLLSMFYNIVGSLVFLSLNGHLILFQMLVDSFQTLPVGPAGLSGAELRTVAEWGGRMFGGAVLVALPAIASLMVVNLAFGVMTRAAPQLNIFMVGFPISLMLGLLIVLYSLPSLLPQMQGLLDEVFGILRRFLGA